MSFRKKKKKKKNAFREVRENYWNCLCLVLLYVKWTDRNESKLLVKEKTTNDWLESVHCYCGIKMHSISIFSEKVRLLMEVSEVLFLVPFPLSKSTTVLNFMGQEFVAYTVSL